jgi:two-component system sensor histidine kinase KdpD
MGGELTPATTPGGGLTMTLSLPAADLGDGGAPPPDLDAQQAAPVILKRLDSWAYHEQGERP